MQYIFLIHLSLNGHIGSFHILAFVNNAAVTWGMQIHLRGSVFISFGYRPRSGNSGTLQFSSVAQSCPTLCNPVNRSTPGLPVITSSRSLLKLMSMNFLICFKHVLISRPLQLGYFFLNPPSKFLYYLLSHLIQVWNHIFISSSKESLTLYLKITTVLLSRPLSNMISLQSTCHNLALLVKVTDRY